MDKQVKISLVYSRLYTVDGFHSKIVISSKATHYIMLAVFALLSPS